MNINYNTKDRYLGAINSISQQYNSMLSDYQTKYVQSNQNPSDKTKKRFLDESSTNLKKKIKELVDIQTEVTRQNFDLVTKVSGLNENINTEKTTNTDFKKNLSALDPIKSSAMMLTGDYNTNYNDRNTQNLSLLIGIVISCALITIMFRIPTTKDQIIRVKDDTITKLYKEGSDYAKKYNVLKEVGKRKAAETEAKINSYYQETKKYRKRAEELYNERAVADAKLSSDAAKSASVTATKVTAPAQKK